MIDRLAFLVGLLVVAFPLSCGAADQYAIGSGQTVTINEYGVCYKVKNSGSGTRMVPTGSAAEWQSVRTYPNGLTFSACAPVCGGTSLAGYCWYAGTKGESCTTLCSSHGGVNMAGTRDYAGSGGTLAHCSAVLSAFFGIYVSAPYNDGGTAAGCYYWTGDFFYTGSARGTGTTTAGAIHPMPAGSYNPKGRICACNS